MRDHRPFVTAIERLSIEDGPGLRDVIFFKGCTHKCIWCHNPETMHKSASVLFHRDRCIACQRCQQCCPNSAIQRNNHFTVDTSRCQRCGRCAAACDTGAIEICGRQYAPDELVTVLLKDKRYFDNSAGGVTFSGGEPTLHMPYLADVCVRLKQHSIHMAIQTAGHFDFEPFSRAICPNIDIVYFDIKIWNENRHRELTGVSNTRILDNFERLVKSKSIEVIARTPLIPGLTDTTQNISDIEKFLRSLGVTTWQKLAFNPGYAAKWEKLGLTPAKITKGI